MRGKVLVVDDEPSLLRLTEYSLGIEGYKVLTAQTGGDALAKVQADRPDVIVLDVMLPDMSGLEVCRQLRSNPETIDLPIIMLSARVQVTDRVRGLKAGADEYVNKPFDSDELLARIETLIDRARRMRQTQPTRQANIMGFVGVKGGVGTTTVALNVALALANNKKRTIAIELAPYWGTFSFQLGLTPTKSLADFYDLDPNRITEQELAARLIQHPSGLQVLFGSQQLNGLKELKTEQAEAIIKGLAGMAEYTVIDVCTHPSAASRAVLQSCDLVVLVLEPDPTCITLGKTTLDLLKTWGVGEESVAAVLVNRTGVIIPALFSEIIPEIRSRLGCKIVGVIPPALDLCLRALKVDTRQIPAQPDPAFVTTISELANRLATSQLTLESVEYAHG
jgi:DNA-binding response OmpR family regulator